MSLLSRREQVSGEMTAHIVGKIESNRKRILSVGLKSYHYKKETIVVGNFDGDLGFLFKKMSKDLHDSQSEERLTRNAVFGKCERKNRKPPVRT